MRIEFYDVFTNIACYSQEDFLVSCKGEVFEEKYFHDDCYLDLKEDVSWRVVEQWKLCMN